MIYLPKCYVFSVIKKDVKIDIKNLLKTTIGTNLNSKFGVEVDTILFCEN